MSSGEEGEVLYLPEGSNHINLPLTYKLVTLLRTEREAAFRNYLLTLPSLFINHVSCQ